MKTEPWLPLHFSIIERADLERYTTHDPACHLAAYAYAWLKAERGSSPSIRQLAGWSGRSNHWCRQVLQEVKQARKEWGAATRNQPLTCTPQTVSEQRSAKCQTQNRTGDLSDSKELHDPDKHESNRIQTEFKQNSNTTRARSTNTTTTTTTIKQTQLASAKAAPIDPPKKPKKPAKETAALTAAWQQVNDLRKEANGGRAWKLTKARRGQLGQRLEEHGADALVTVWRWVLYSQHDRAVYLRGQGYDTPETVMRPSNYPTYLELAEREQRAARPQPTKPTVTEPAVAAWT